MTIRGAVVAGTLALLAGVALCAAVAQAEEAYAVNGRDVFVVGNGDVHNATSYRGVERLSIRRSPSGTTYTAHSFRVSSGTDPRTIPTTSRFLTSLLQSSSTRRRCAICVA